MQLDRLKVAVVSLIAMFSGVADLLVQAADLTKSAPCDQAFFDFFAGPIPNFECDASGRAATLHVTRQGVRVVGTDAWSWDAPLSFTRARFAREGDPSIIWEGRCSVPRAG